MPSREPGAYGSSPGELLAAHLRAEKEEELFPLMERLVSEEDLRSIRSAPRERTPPPS